MIVNIATEKSVLCLFSYNLEMYKCSHLNFCQYKQNKNTNIPIGSCEMCFLHQKHISQLTIIVIEVLVYMGFFYFWLFFRLWLGTVFCCLFWLIEIHYKWLMNVFELCNLLSEYIVISNRVAFRLYFTYYLLIYIDISLIGQFIVMCFCV